MTSSIERLRDTEMSVLRLGDERSDAPELIWAHGWGQSGAALAALGRSLEREFPSAVLDLPGFGASAPPPESWGTGEYADAIAEWIARRPPRRRIWIGHSFGCRIGLQLAARRPTALAGMVLLAAAGLRRRRSFVQGASLRTRIALFKLAKRFAPPGAARERLYARFGSADARSAGPMRTVFIRTVNEDLTETARAVACPTLLIYGRDDDETPPEMGERLRRLVPRSELLVLDGFDHHTILTTGRHQVLREIRAFAGSLA